MDVCDSGRRLTAVLSSHVAASFEVGGFEGQIFGFVCFNLENNECKATLGSFRSHGLYTDMCGKIIFF